MSALSVIFAAAVMLLVAAIVFFYVRQNRRSAAAGSPCEYRRMRFPKAHRCTRIDALLALIITVVYGFVGFSNLGDTVAPQSFYRLTEASPTLTIDLGQGYLLRSIVYYTGSFHDVYGNYTGYSMEISIDGEEWTDYGVLEQTHANTFHWVDNEFDSVDIMSYGVPYCQYVRLTAPVFPMELGEIVFVDVETEAPIDPSGIKTSPIDAKAALFDEQSLKPEVQLYSNSMYFDEIYHARTAREFIKGDHVYENTHPPLGKAIISLGELMFGMTPFGWRFMGVLFGILMLPFMYVFVKNIFGKTWLAACATTVFAFDFMHYVQTRIATIDTYGLFFTILMYFFMYRFLAAGYDAPARSRLVPLALCGVSFGLGIASKWTCFYAAAGLVLLYVIGAVAEGRRLYAEDRRGEFWKKFGAVIATSVVFFVIVGFGIYILSYIPFCRSNGVPFSLGAVWENQVSMWSYHSGLEATHSYQSSWWQWLIDARPILYFRDIKSGSAALFAAFNSPLVAWMGLVAMVMLVASLYGTEGNITRRVGLFFAALSVVGFAGQVIPFIKSDYTHFTNPPFSFLFSAGILGTVVTPFAARHLEPQTTKSPAQNSREIAPGLVADNSRSVFIIIGAIAQLLAWIPVSRCTFAYHYFPTSFFLVLAIAAIFDRWDDLCQAEGKEERFVIPIGKRLRVEWNRGSTAKRVCVYFTAACVVLFAMYYPVLTGLYASDAYRALLRWFPSWPL